MTFTMLGAKVPERVITGVVSSDYFDVSASSPVLGRLITPADETRRPLLRARTELCVLGQGVRPDPKILGRTFTINDRVHTVIGVLPPFPTTPTPTTSTCRPHRVPFRSRPMMITTATFAWSPSSRAQTRHH